jgi:glycosyltransferase involved in cell wall biosynthesis
MNGTQALNGFGEANPGQVPTRSLIRLFDVIQRVGRPCMVCSRVPLKHPEIAALLSQPLVEGVILESEYRELLAAFPHRLGFYTNSGGDWQLPAQVVADMVYVGRWTDFGARVAWLAWRAGIRRIHNASAFQSHHTRGTFLVAIEKSLRSLLYRLSRSPLLRKPIEKSLRALRVEQFLFSRRLRVIQGMPLPITDASTVWQQGKIVMVGGTLGPGGAERQLTATLLGLFARGHRDVHFLHHSPMYKPNDFFLPQLIEAGIPFSQVDLFGDSNPVSPGIEEALEQRLVALGELGAEVAAYAREFLVRRPSIVHVWLDYMNVVAGLAALLVGVPRIVLSCRSLSPAHFAFNQPYMRPIYRLLAEFPNVTFLNNSDAGASDYRRWLGVASLNIQVIRNGFDFSLLPPPKELSYLRSEYRSRLGIPADAPVVGVIMRVSEEKRPLLWIEIARQVAQRISKAHFIVVGDGPMRDQVEKVAQSVLPGKIHFTGHEKSSMSGLAAMDLFLLTSRVEGLPNVLIEAQVLGVPPVAIDVGGVSETMMAGESGWLMDTDNPQTIANQIMEIFTQPERVARASAMGKTFVTEEFCSKKMIEKTIAVYGFK